MVAGTRMALSDWFRRYIQGKDSSVSKGLDVRMWKEWGWLVWALSYWEMDRVGQCREPSQQETENAVVMSRRYLSLEGGWKVDRAEVDRWSPEALQWRPVARRWRRAARPLCSPENLREVFQGSSITSNSNKVTSIPNFCSTNVANL